ncbi:MAG: response regulator transcription factor [Verrucomicrobiota bacterium]|jgi:DNA-binding NarL/FixJ family response regulator
MKTPLPAPTCKKTVLLVDDHPLLREGLRSIINQQADLMACGEADTAQAALLAVEKLQPDIVLVDISMPGRDGLDLAKDLHHWYPQLPVLMLSQHDEAIYAERALSTGARGYIMKQAPSESLIQAIRQVLAGSFAISRGSTDRLIQQVSQGARRLSPVELLSNRELEIFRLVGEGHNRHAVAASLHLSVKTIDTHRTNIQKKLRLQGATELVHQAMNFVQAEMHPAADVAKNNS